MKIVSIPFIFLFSSFAALATTFSRDECRFLEDDSISFGLPEPWNNRKVLKKKLMESVQLGIADSVTSSFREILEKGRYDDIEKHYLVESCIKEALDKNHPDIAGYMLVISTDMIESFSETLVLEAALTRNHEESIFFLLRDRGKILDAIIFAGNRRDAEMVKTILKTMPKKKILFRALECVNERPIKNLLRKEIKKRF